MHNIIIKDEHDLDAPIQYVSEARTLEVERIVDELRELINLLHIMHKSKIKMLTLHFVMH